MVADLSPWQSFKEQFKLTEEQLNLFKKYTELLLEANKKTNLTGIESLDDIINYHFADSLALLNYVDLKNKKVVDVGSGAGFPGIPLAMISKCDMHLLEVRVKRLDFLKEVKEKLSLSNITIDDRDWLTFIRAKKNPVDYYIARASLQPEELVKVLNVESKATVVYWAAEHWEPAKNIVNLIIKNELYQVGDRKRRLIFFHKRK